MKKIKCFEVMGHTDTTEGRGPMKVVTRFSSLVEAKKYVETPEFRKHCVMGVATAYDKQNIRETVICVMDSVEEMIESSQEELKQRALAKLSDAERKALGL